MELKKTKKIQPVCLVLCFAILFCHNILPGEENSAEYKLNREFIVKFSQDFNKTLLSPKDWNKKDFLVFSSIIGTGVILYAFDQDINDSIEKRQNSFSRDSSRVISFFGHGAFLAGFIATLYASGEFSDNNNLRKTALLSLESFITSGVLVLGLKVITGRSRPGTAEGKDSFHFFSTRSSYNSFPSGHTTSAFAVAATVADQTENTLVDIFAYSLAALVAFSRVHQGKHWASDVFIGSALGYFIGKKICALNQGKNTEKLKVAVGFSDYGPAFSLRISF